MFKHLNKHPVILVTGPQRSGTTIASRMIAQDTGYKLIDEKDYGVHNETQFTEVQKQRNVVIHCPAMVHTLKDNQHFIVFMIRNTEDIIKSQERIKWQEENKEKAKMGAVSDPRPIAEIKQEWWYNNKTPNSLDVCYEDLAKHPLWVEKEKRKKFAPKQTQ